MRFLTSALLICFLIINTPLTAGEPGAKQTVEYLQKLQTATGGFLSQPSAPNIRIAPTLRATSAGVRALHYFGGEVPDKAAAIKYVDSCYDPQTGGFSDMPKGKVDFFATAVGLMAVAELKMPADKYAGAGEYLTDHAKTFEDIRIAVAGFEAMQKASPKNDAWIADVRKSQNKDGTFGKGLGVARDTGGSVAALLRMGVKPSNPDIVLKAMKDGQRQNGGWGKEDSPIASDLETTYRVMRCFMMLKTQSGNVEGVRSFVAKCRNADGGYGVAPGQPSAVNGTYYAGSILHWLKQ